MPSSFLLFVILVAGYILLSRSVFLKFRQQRLNQQRLIFETIFWGAVLFAATYMLRLGVEFIIPRGSELIVIIHNILPVKAPLIGTSIATVLLSAVISLFSHLWNKQKYIYAAINAVGNDLEKTFKEAMFTRSLLQITLSNGKFYVGWITKPPVPSDYNYIQITPLFSGYRDSETKEMIPTTEYETALTDDVTELQLADRKHHENSKQKRKKDFKEKEKSEYMAQLHIDVTLPLDKIISVSYHSQRLYEKFNVVPASLASQEEVVEVPKKRHAFTRNFFFIFSGILLLDRLRKKYWK